MSGEEHAITTSVTDDVGLYVLRRFPPGDRAVTNEVLALDRLKGLGDLVPALVAYDDSAAEPSILTKRLPGTPPSSGLTAETIAVQLGAVLARIHAVDGTGLRPALDAPPTGESPIARRGRHDWQTWHAMAGC